ncbi:hypothetical protein C4K40_3318 [Pseudomonas sp. CMR5c]|nr:hypothetical protein C4K40_3318 [Pseudomonas sp. CMR5c]
MLLLPKSRSKIYSPTGQVKLQGAQLYKARRLKTAQSLPWRTSFRLRLPLLASQDHDLQRPIVP